MQWEDPHPKPEEITKPEDIKILTQKPRHVKNEVI